MENVSATLLSQYANSPTLVQLISNINGYIDPSADIDAFYDDVFNIQTAQGFGLDIWGRILGVTRVLSVSAGNYFGFEGPSSYSGLPFNQAIFYSGQATTSNYALLDGPYRVLLLAKAAFNITNCSVLAINQILLSLFGPTGAFPVGGNCYCTDGENMTMTYTFGSVLSALQSAIVFQSGVLPRPAGVFASVIQ